jgi:Dolichyl-phosphate-mannose-protein mannosyltransferase
MAPGNIIRLQQFESKISLAIWIAAFALGIALRLYMIVQPPIVTPDSTDRYEPLARKIISGEGLSRPHRPTYGPMSFNQPGYPLFLAAVYSVAGENRRAVVIAQALLEVLTVLFVLVIARWTDLAPLSRAAIALTAFVCPVLPLLTRAIWSETMATVALTGTVLAWLRAVRGGGPMPWIFAAAGSALCLLIRPDSAAAIGLLAIAVLVITGRALPFRRIALATLVFVAALTPWVARNYIELGKFEVLGVYSGFLDRSYVRWLNTWVDDASQLAPYWWYSTEASSPAYFPADKVIDPEERKRAEAALAEGRKSGSFNVDPVKQTFDELTAKARSERPFRTFVVVPLRRLASTWINLAGYAKSAAARSAWITLLLAALVGAGWGLRHRFNVALLLLAAVAGRSMLPLVFAIGVEPRFVVEALPAVFIFAGFFFQAGLGCLRGRAV